MLSVDEYTKLKASGLVRLTKFASKVFAEWTKYDTVGHTEQQLDEISIDYLESQIAGIDDQITKLQKTKTAIATLMVDVQEAPEAEIQEES